MGRVTAHGAKAATTGSKAAGAAGKTATTVGRTAGKTGASAAKNAVRSTPVAKPGDAKAIEAFKIAQREGQNKVDDFISAIKSRDLSRIQKAAMEVQGDNQAIANINKRNNFIKNQFNRTMQQNYTEVDRRVIERLAKERGVSPGEIRVVSATNPNRSLTNVKVGYDRDITYRVGREDIPADEVQKIYNEEFRRVTGADAGKLCQQAVDRVHPEGYGRRPSDLNRALGGQAHMIEDSEQMGKAISYKGHHPFEKAAKATETGDLGEAQRQMFDGMRQISKQWNNQVKSTLDYAKKNPGKLGPIDVPSRLDKAMNIMDQINHGASPTEITQQLRGLGLTPRDVATQVGDFFDTLVESTRY